MFLQNIAGSQKGVSVTLLAMISLAKEWPKLEN